MKIKIIGLCSILVASIAFAGKDASKLNTEEEKLSYTIGVDLAVNFKQQGVNLKPEVLLQGLKDGLTDKKDMLLTQEQMAETLKTFQKQLMEKKQAEFKQKAEQNKKKGEEFLSQNKTKDGIVTTKSGLQYKIIKEGEGNIPKDSDIVEVEYTGKLIDGTVFDSSDNSDKPITFRVSEVIPGWTEALKLMKTGAEWEIFIPSDLAYGERGVGGPIGPNETLIFNIRLKGIKKEETTTSNKEQSSKLDTSKTDSSKESTKPSTNL